MSERTNSQASRRHAREVSLLGRFNRVDNWARSTVRIKGVAGECRRRAVWGAGELIRWHRAYAVLRANGLGDLCSRSSTLHSPRLKAVMSPASHFGPRTACSRRLLCPPGV